MEIALCLNFKVSLAILLLRICYLMQCSDHFPKAMKHCYGQLSEQIFRKKMIF